MDPNTKFTLQEISKHNSADDCWIILNGSIYDLTSYIKSHPGGQSIILRYAGKDGTIAFSSTHNEVKNKQIIFQKEILKIAQEYKIGDLSEEDAQVQKKKNKQISKKKKQEFFDKIKTLPPIETMLNVYDLQDLAMKTFTKEAKNYFMTGSNDEIVIRENELGFQKIWLRPRVLVNVKEVNVEQTLLGCKFQLPLYISATALAKLAHPEGELPIIRAANNQNIIYMISTLSSTNLDKIFKNKNPNQQLFFQLYVNRNRKIAEELIKKAENSGALAIVLTVDLPVSAKRERDQRQHAQAQSKIQTQLGKEIDKSQGVTQAVTQFIDPTVDWNSLKEFMSLSKLPFILKGIQTSEDALLAYKAGVSGIIISNHGGRQLDYSRSSIETLQEISIAYQKAGIKDKIEIYIDGGIRRGTDIFKALALGAKAVGIGRPMLYGLGTYGQEGIEKVIQIMGDEFRMCMRLMGCRTLEDIKPEMLVANNLTDHITLTPPLNLGVDIYEPLKHASKL